MPERILAVRMEEELIQRIKTYAAANKVTIKDYITRLVEEDLSNNRIIYAAYEMAGSIDMEILDQRVAALEMILKNGETQAQHKKKNP